MREVDCKHVHILALWVPACSCSPPLLIHFLFPTTLPCRLQAPGSDSLTQTALPTPTTTQGQVSAASLIM